MGLRALTDIRPFRPNDLPAIVSLWTAAWQATLPSIDFSARQPWLEQHLRALDGAGILILCAVDEADGPRGFATLDLTSGEMDQLAVAPDAFGQGVADALIEAVKRRAPGRIRLTVNQDNPRAMAFYRRAGFTIVAAGANPHSGLRTWEMAWVIAPASAASPAGG